MNRVIALLGLVLATVVVPQSVARAASTGFCGHASTFPGHTFRWVGTDTIAPHDWVDAANWRVNGHQPGSPPGQSSDNSTADYACIPRGAFVIISGAPEGETAGLAAIDLDRSARLLVRHGGHLFLNGASSTRRSIVRVGATLQISSSSLGGHGMVDVAGLLRITSTGIGASTITTRRCDEYGTQAAPHGCRSHVVTNPGRVVVLRSGRMAVDGSPKGGINLEDRHIIDNAGRVVLSGAGYIAADDGTTIVNRPGGHLVIADNGGVYRGRFGRYAGLPQAQVTNAGTLEKTAGNDVSVVGVPYLHQHGGTVHVGSGTLSIARRAVPTASVNQGRTYGTGVCRTATVTDPECHTVVAPGAPQATSVQLPGGFSGTGSVAIEQVNAAGAPSGSFRSKVQRISTNGATRTTAHPLRFVFTFLQSANPALSSWRTLRVWRSEHGGPYVKVKACRNDGTPVSGPACEDLRSYPANPSASHASGGVVTIVVRTISNSRWVVIR